MSRLWRGLRFIFGHRKFDRELGDEMRQHLEMKVQKLVESGVAPEEARYRAQREFGNTLLLEENSREVWQWRPVEEIAQDLRYALRMLRRSPGFTAVAVLSLALGIGANTAVFSVMDTVLLKSMPVEDPDRLVLVGAECKGASWIFMYPTFRDVRDQQQVFSGISAISDSPRMMVTIPGAPQLEAAYVPGTIVSGNYFSVLGVRPLMGRMFNEADDRLPGTGGVQDRVAVISYGLWQRQYGGDAAVSRKKISINHEMYTIIGVTPREFRGHRTGYAPDIWAPMNQAKSPEELNQRNWAFFSGVMARLKPGVSVRQAEAAMTAAYRQVLAGEVGRGIEESLRSPGPSQPVDRKISDYHITLKPGGGGLGMLREKYAQSLRIIMAVVGLVLLIACSNVANLLLARATSRRSEIGLRLALGSGRYRLMRQLLTESVLLALMGGAAGLLVAYWLADALATFIATGGMLSLQISPDTRVLAFTTAVCFASAFLFGLVPAWQATQLEIATALKGSSRTQTGGRPRQRLSRVLLVSQVALSLVLLIGAGLLAHSLANLHRLDPGFRLQNVLMLEVQMEDVERVQGKPDFAVAQRRLPGVFRDLEERLNALAGVRSASVSWLGLFSENDLYTSLVIRGATREGAPAHLNMVSSRYFETVGMQVVMGRGFKASDDERAHRVLVINEALARKYLPGQNPLGKLAVPNVDELKGTPFEIVGILRDAKYNDLRAPVEPMFYLPLAQAPYPIQSVEVQTAGDPLAMASQVRRLLREMHRDLMISEVTTLAQRVDSTVIRERMLAELSGVFGVLALVLACVGLYGTMSYAVARRTSEIGIRMALGARSGEMLWMVLRETSRLVVLGVAIGLPVALAATRFLQDYLFELKATDPATIAGAALILAAIAMLAGYLPARRAARVDPMTALRYE
ncbi:MAG: ADOP family duplicated permease [Acidobacteriia bacterium]|nr:ADOP family duplicated permease [Terriglobia bacterium]